MGIEKFADCIGRAFLYSAPFENFDLWSCRQCRSIFTAVDTARGRKINCGNCKEEIILDPYGHIRISAETIDKKDKKKNKPEALK